MDFALSDIEALAKLLAPAPTQAVQEYDTIPVSELSKPSTFGPKDLLDVKVAAPRAFGSSRRGVQECRAQQHGTSAPTVADERQQHQQHDHEADDEDADDGREVPEYDFRYKQSVTTSDNFLGMSGKDPSSTCCEQLVVVLQLPQTASAAELQLDTTPTWLRLASEHYKLRLSLPHKVDAERGTAKWDGKRKALSVTLPIIRPDPFA